MCAHAGTQDTWGQVLSPKEDQSQQTLPSQLSVDQVLKTILWKHCQSSPGWWPLEPSARMFPETSMSLAWISGKGTVGVPKAPGIVGVGGRKTQKDKGFCKNRAEEPKSQ